MRQRDTGPQVFRLWGWPLLNACAFVAFVSFIAYSAGPWALLVLALPLIYTLFRIVLLMTVRVVIDGKDLRWRTVITSSAADLQLVATVHPGSGQEGWLRLIEIADGQRLRIGPGAEFDRLVVALQAEVPDLQVEPQQPRYASWRKS